MVVAGHADTTRAAAPRRGPPVSASWTGVPLDRVASRLTLLVGRPVLVDRRVDPATPVTLDLRDVPLEEVLEQVCRTTSTGCAVLADTIQFVPEGGQADVVRADVLRTAATGRLPRPRRELALRRAPWAWPDGATPEALVKGAANDAGIDLEGLDVLPHDHLRGADLPDLPLSARLDLLLVQYGRRVDWGRARGEGTRVRAPVVVIADGGKGAAPLVAAAADGWEGLAAPRVGTAAAATWSLEVAAPLDRLLATIAERMALDLDLDRDGLRRRGIQAAGIVRLSVKDATREELLDRVTTPLGLGWTIEGKTLRVAPAAAE